MQGVKKSTCFNMVMVIIKVVVIVLFIVVGVWYVKPENWTPFIVPYTDLGVKNPVAFALNYIHLDWVGGFILMKNFISPACRKIQK